MLSLSGKNIDQIKLIGDLLIINVAFLLGYIFRFDSLADYFINQYLAFHLYFNLAWICSAYFLNSYNTNKPVGNIRLLLRLLQLLLLHLLLLVAFNGIIKTFYSRLFILYSYSLIVSLIPFWRIILNQLLKLYRKGGFNTKNVAIIGHGLDAGELKEYFDGHPEEGYRFSGFINHERSQEDISHITNYVINNKVEEVYASMNSLTGSQLRQLIEFAENNLIRIRLLPETEGFPFKKVKVEFYDHIPVLALRPFPLDEPLNRTIKRGFDLFFSLIICVCILSWLLPILAFLIKLDSKGPVFFRQQRSGRNNSLFSCYKLRSMRENSESDKKQAVKDDFRITRLGRLLRKYNLDELPQFFNVLKGDMSVVGPRPHMQLHTEEYSQLVDKYMMRHFIKPGITGLSQVLGFRGETIETRQMKNRVKVDIFYMENWTFLLDLKVIFLTVWNSFIGQENAW